MLQTPRSAIIYVMSGAIGGQAGLHAMACVFASASLARRLAWGVALGLGLFAAWAAGRAILWASLTYAPSYWQDAAISLFLLPLLAVSFQSPLWGARCFFRWRIFHPHDPARRLPFRPLGIRDILAAIGFVAVALSLLRVGSMIVTPPSETLLLRLMMVALVAAILSLFTTPPVLMATLRARRAGMASAIVWAVGVAVMVAIPLFAATIRGRYLPWQELDMTLSLATGYFGSMIVPLLVLRRLGYRLYWGRRGRGEGGGRTAEGGR